VKGQTDFDLLLYGRQSNSSVTDTMRIHSINIARTRQLDTPKGPKKTGIVKTPVAGNVRIHKLGVEGDYIADKNVHGGEDQAVYLYSAEDNAWWAQALGREIAPGTFGENLTLEDFNSRECRIGDRIQIGDLILEISAPRARMGDSHFVKTFFQTRRPGAYARVITEGNLCAGDTAEWIRTAQDFAKTLDVFIEWDQKIKSPAILLQALNSPIAVVHKNKLQQWYAAISG
jgi:MOSC domain-containing protein YiiM